MGQPNPKPLSATLLIQSAMLYPSTGELAIPVKWGLSSSSTRAVVQTQPKALADYCSVRGILEQAVPELVADPCWSLNVEVSESTSTVRTYLVANDVTWRYWKSYLESTAARVLASSADTAADAKGALQVPVLLFSATSSPKKP